MGDMGDIFNDMKRYRKKKRARNLERADPTGWTQHNEYHWWRELLGDRLDYWPSSGKFMWRGKVRAGGVKGFINNQIKIAERRL